LAKMTISDNGCGMAEETMQKIFQSHFTTKETGHGLGLANCRKIIKNHNGDITVTSRVNEGTNFTITIPKEQAEMIK
jgi:signal transduction histidine kinase